MNLLKTHRWILSLQSLVKLNWQTDFFVSVNSLFKLPTFKLHSPLEWLNPSISHYKAHKCYFISFCLQFQSGGCNQSKNVLLEQLLRSTPSSRFIISVLRVLKIVISIPFLYPLDLKYRLKRSTLKFPNIFHQIWRNFQAH